MTQERKKLVELKNVSLTFNKGKSNEVEAIDDVSFDIYEGEIFGLVGESGSGKTTIGRSVLKLSDIDSGTVTFSGNEVYGWSHALCHQSGRWRQCQVLYRPAA